jgi:hypothetical protein
MSDGKPAEQQADRPAVPWTKRFRRKIPSTLPTPEQLRRQDAVLRCAWTNLGESGPVIAFLNTHNELLGGQPLYLALESDEGLLRVEGLLGEIGLKA